MESNSFFFTWQNSPIFVFFFPLPKCPSVQTPARDLKNSQLSLPPGSARIRSPPWMKSRAECQHAGCSPQREAAIPPPFPPAETEAHRGPATLPRSAGRAGAGFEPRALWLLGPGPSPPTGGLQLTALLSQGLRENSSVCKNWLQVLGRLRGRPNGKRCSKGIGNSSGLRLPRRV